MKTALIAAAAALQVLVLAHMAGEREWVVRTGRTIYLRTTPVDPRDPYRGDYVRLDYEVGHVPTNLLTQGLVVDAGKREKGRKVYASLVEQPGGVFGLATVSDRMPDEGVFLRGRTERAYGGRTVPVRYGIEAFFVQQKKGRELEDGRRRGDVQVPLEMGVAVGGEGTAVLKGYRWCSLGVGLKMDMVSNRFVRAVTFQLVNVSSNDLAIVDLPGGRSLTLEDDWIRGWGNHDWQWVGPKTPAPAVTDADVFVLKPNESREIRVNLESPEWFVSKPGEGPKSLSGLGWDAMFRLVYHAPDDAACLGLKHAGIIWHGEIVSRAFGGGRVD